MKQILTFEEIENNVEVQTYLKYADYAFSSMGYKEHGSSHALYSATVACQVLRDLGYDQRQQELAKIAAYVHDIGLFIGKQDHAQSSAVIFLNIINKDRYDGDAFSIVGAIGCHEDKCFAPVSEIAAALVIGDKTDMRYERARTKDPFCLDKHGRVLLACKKVDVVVKKEKMKIELHLKIDTMICSVMDYFEIFMGRTNYCRKASDVLKCNFELYINEDKFL
ncbi:MAG: HD domain-containing protein [Endomicrobium sp.]|jgi:metal-dependent HD superfamily phosphatase/phosphodiesterase|nr:HD domain-containing protein [Endomicrobium sp.]